MLTHEYNVAAPLPTAPSPPAVPVTPVAADADLRPSGPRGTADPAWDRRLIARLFSGAPTAHDEVFTALYESLHEPIYNHLYRLTNDPVEAADLTQDTFVRVYRKLGDVRQDSRFKPWLYQIASNIWRDKRRHDKLCRMEPLATWFAFAMPEYGAHGDATEGRTGLGAARHADLVTDQDRRINPDAVALAHETSAAVRAILMQLRPMHRLALLLRHYEQLSYYEIADVLGCTLTAVKTLLSRARKEFRAVCATCAARTTLTPAPLV